MGARVGHLLRLGERRRAAGRPFDGAELRVRREMLGYSRQDLAQRWGVAESTLFRWEHGLMAIEKAGLVADALTFLESLPGQETWVRTMDGRLRLASGKRPRTAAARQAAGRARTGSGGGSARG